MTRHADRRTPPAFPRARKRFGQHFLEPAWVSRVLAAVAPHPDDVCLEIGPGRGALTIPLAARVARLVAVEIDRDLAERLRAREVPRLSVIEGDFLAVDVPALLAGAPGPARVVANLPYNVASPILFRLLAHAEDGRRFADAHLMVQREVADRLVARPGDPAHGALGLQVQRLADVELALLLPPGAFRPPPKVHSAVVRLRFRPDPFGCPDPVLFEHIVRGVFLHRRKTLLNALASVAATRGRSAAAVLASAGLDPQLRPQMLDVAAYVALTRAML